MDVQWTPIAHRDLALAYDYIAQDNPSAARDVIATIRASVATLSRHPAMGRKGRVPGTRELVVRPYIVVYCLSPGMIEIVAIIHGARKWPDVF